MSMIRDLRAAVRPSLRKSNTPYNSYDATRDPSASSAVVDCAVYRDGRRLDDAACQTPREAMLRVREEGGFAWIGLHEPTEEEFAGIAREFDSTRSPSRTPSTPTSGPSWSATTTRCSRSSRRSTTSSTPN